MMRTAMEDEEGGVREPSFLPLEMEMPNNRKERVVPYVYLVTSIAALNSINMGFDIGVFPDAARAVQKQWNLSSTKLEALVGVLEVAAIVGAACAHWVVDRKGRRATFGLSSVVFVIGVSIMSLSEDYPSLFIARIITGVGVGIGFSIDATFIAEIAPTAHRGALVTWAEVSVNLGIVLGFIVAFVMDNNSANSWRLMLACGLFAPILLLILVITVLPESPRWLEAHGRKAEAAALSRRLGQHDEDDETKTNSTGNVQQERDLMTVSWKHVFTAYKNNPVICRALTLAIFLAIAQQLMAEQVLLYYQHQILKSMGINDLNIFAARVAMGLIKMSCAALAGALLDRAGRRPLLLTSVAAMGLSLAGIGLAIRFRRNMPVVMLIWIYMAAFSLGIGPVAWLYASEVLPDAYRAKGMALATCSNKMTSFLISSTFLTAAKALPGNDDAAYFFVFAAVSLIILILIYRFIPETKNIDIDQMLHYFDSIVHNKGTEINDGNISKASNKSRIFGESPRSAVIAYNQLPPDTPPRLDTLKTPTASPIQNPMIVLKPSPSSLIAATDSPTPLLKQHSALSEELETSSFTMIETTLDDELHDAGGEQSDNNLRFTSNSIPGSPRRHDCAAVLLNDADTDIPGPPPPPRCKSSSLS